ncbi:MAG: hypothetical protein N2645_18740 [Clostridia bacterium]|nr:hypothetical protein [Clostridia bacterium]
MMINYGVIVDLSKSDAMILSPDDCFVFIKRKPGFVLGQTVWYENTDIIDYKKRKIIKVISGVASLAAIFIFMLSYALSIWGSETYAYIHVDINPSMEFVVDNQNKVIETRAINAEGQIILKHLGLNNLPVVDAVSQSVVKAAELGYLKEHSENVILVSAAVNEKSSGYKKNKNTAKEELFNLLCVIKENIKQRENDKVQVKVLLIEQQKKDAAQKSEISMGRYAIYKKAEDKGYAISLERARKESIKDILYETGLHLDEKDVSIRKEGETDASKSTTKPVLTPQKLLIKKTALPPATPKPKVNRSTTPRPVKKNTNPQPDKKKKNVKTKPEDNKKSGIIQWKLNIYFTKGQIVYYSGKRYVCAQSHLAIPDWTPTYAHTLWIEIKE